MDKKTYNFDSKVEGTIHDSKYDYYGRKLATCTSDGQIYIYDTTDPEKVVQTSVFRAHSSPVWRLDWAHPRFGNLLAACTYDKEVSIWQEYQTNSWRQVYSHRIHQGSVNSVQWAPWERGAILAACGSDGRISIVVKKSEDSWQEQSFEAHPMGVNSISFQPFTSYEDLASDDGPKHKKLRLVSGSCDKSIKIWEWDDISQQTPKEILSLNQQQGGHTEWVRDVAWSPILQEDQLIASCGEDNQVIIWKITDINDYTKIKATQLTKIGLEGAAWRTSWSLTGSMLAVSYAGKDIQSSVAVIQEDENGDWRRQEENQQ